MSKEERAVLTSWDDYPVHQVAEPIRHAGTSDRHFYDRYYFNLHASSDELFMVMGMGQYPNLGTHDAFVCVRRGDAHHVVRASKELVDRMDLTVGPFRVEVVEPLRRLRFVCEPSNEYALACDLTWEGAIPAYLEPRQFIRKFGRVTFDTQRLAQTGCWSGTIEVEGETITATPDRFKGTRDRSWGVRPVGDPEPPGIFEGTGALRGLWNYAPMQFDDFSILYMLNEEPDGTRVLEEAVRLHPDGGVEQLGRPEWEHTLDPGTRMITKPSTLRFPDAPGGALEIAVTPLCHNYIAVGTGYGVGDDFRHGQYRGELWVDGRSWPMSELDSWAWFGIVDQAARFEITGPGPGGSAPVVGYGLHEHGIFGPFPALGLPEATSVAP
jgi:hypothetical protein